MKKEIKLLKRIKKEYLKAYPKIDNYGFYEGCYVWVKPDSELSYLGADMPGVVTEIKKNEYEVAFVDKGNKYSGENKDLVIQSVAYYPRTDLLLISEAYAEENFKFPVEEY